MLEEQSQPERKTIVKWKVLSEEERAIMLEEDHQQAVAIRKAQIGLAIKENIKKGEIKRTIEVAKNLLNDGISVEKVSYYTKLTHEEIDNLQIEMKASK